MRHQILRHTQGDFDHTVSNNSMAEGQPGECTKSLQWYISCKHFCRPWMGFGNACPVHYCYITAMPSPQTQKASS